MRGFGVVLTRATLQSNRVPIEKLSIFRRSAIGPVLRCIRVFSLPSSCIHGFLMIDLPWVVPALSRS